MKCHIVKNGGYMLWILCFWILATNSVISEKIFSIQEYCSSISHIHNIEPGEPYQFTLKSEASTGISKPYQKSKRKCRKELKTSDPAAHFVVLISNMTIPACSNCRCNYFEISDVRHSKRYCDTSETEYFVSKSDQLTISFFHGPERAFDVTFTFSVERNVYTVTGSSDNHGIGHFIETPYFPIPYPPSYRAEYVLQSDVKGHVVLLFLDFQISRQSFIEVVGNNDTHPTRFYGNIFRPPVIVSQSNILTLKFESSDEDGMLGFRALCSFVKTPDSVFVPYTDCGGAQTEQVGFMNIKAHTNFALYDCVWHIISHTFFTKSYRSISIHLKDIGHKSTLEIRSGRHSKSEIVKIIDCAIENCTILDIETTANASSDLYIRFHGYLDVHSVVNMSYSPYHTGSCTNEEFICEDGRCLQQSFVCDGIKHCPNGTDEVQCPTPVHLDPIPSPPNIKKENIQGDDVYKKFFIIVLVGSLGLITVCLSISIFLYKHHKYVPVNIEETGNQVIGAMSVAMPPMYPVNVYSNDNLPSYEDFIKSSDYFPPLLYTRAKQRFAPKDTCMQCTTSFSSCSRIRHHSESCSFRSLNTSSDMFANATDAPCPEQACSNCCDVEIVNNSLPKTSNGIRRSYSLDTKLNDLVKHDTCHLFLSIMHPVCSHMHVECHTLPANFKMGSFKTNTGDPKTNEATWLSSDASLNNSKDRRFTWSFVSHSSSGSEILTVVKTRCCSDPCKGISIHCSLYP